MNEEEEEKQRERFSWIESKDVCFTLHNKLIILI
jgi:hypothetical protein